MAGLTHPKVAIRWLETLWRDAAASARFLRRNPGFSSVVLVTLALGIGVNTSVFGAYYGIVLKPLPFDRAGRLVEIQARRTSSPAEWQRYVSAAIIEDVGLRSTSLQHVAYAMATPALRTDARGVAAQILPISCATRGGRR